MKNIANADRPKSVGAMLPPRPLRRSGKVAQTACNSDRREGKSCIPTLNQTFADSRILKISKFPTFRIAVVELCSQRWLGARLAQPSPALANKPQTLFPPPMLPPIRATPLGDLNDAQRLAVEHGVGDADGPQPLLV